MSDPVAGRPLVPEGYGIKGSGEKRLAWPEISRWLEEARNYWIVTASPQGQPHAMPVWGVWLDGGFYFGTDRASRKARNLDANPRVVVHLESGDDVVVLNGTVDEAIDPDVRERVLAAYAPKYGMGPGDMDAGALLYELKPQVALSWREQDYPQSATRWTFGVG